MRLADARYAVFCDQLPDLLTRLELEESMEEAKRSHDLGDLNEHLYAELDKLRAVDVRDTEMISSEVSRSKAIEGLARVVVDTANTVLDATRMRAEFSKGTVVSVPKMLEG